MQDPGAARDEILSGFYPSFFPLLFSESTIPKIIPANSFKMASSDMNVALPDPTADLHWGDYRGGIELFAPLHYEGLC